MRSFILAAAAIAVAGVSNFASAGALVGETAKFAGDWRINHATNSAIQAGPALTELGTPVLVSNSGNPNTGFSRPVGDAVTYGDDYALAGTGILDEFSFSLFNGTGTGSANVTGGSVSFSFWDVSTFTGVGSSTALGTFNVTLPYTVGTPLAPGFFGTFTITNLGALGIDLVSPLLITQSYSGVAGRNGFVSWPNGGVTVGTTGGVDFYMNSNTLAENFYVLSGGATPVNVGYRVVVPEPGLIGLGAVSALGLLARRRRLA